MACAILGLWLPLYESYEQSVVGEFGSKKEKVTGIRGHIMGRQNF